MLGLPVLDVAIGVALLYPLFALMCTTLNEIIAGALDKRGKMLQSAIQGLVGDSTVANALYAHPAIASLAPTPNKSTGLPSYIPAERFAHALMDHLSGASSVTDRTAIENGVAKLPDEARNQLKPLLEFSKMDPAQFQKKVEEWYEQMMDRVNGWYKRYIQKRWHAAANLGLQRHRGPGLVSAVALLTNKMPCRPGRGISASEMLNRPWRCRTNGLCTVHSHP